MEAMVSPGAPILVAFFQTASFQIGNGRLGHSCCGL
jgi:hypothetical protein